MDVGTIQDANMAALSGTMSLVSLLISVVVYVYIAYCFYALANKTNTPNAWWGWVPILNLFLFVAIAQKPWWWVLLLLIPIVDIVLMVIIWMKIAERRGHPSWLGILMIVPIANFIIPGYLAFTK